MLNQWRKLQDRLNEDDDFAALMFRDPSEALKDTQIRLTADQLRELERGVAAVRSDPPALDAGERTIPVPMPVPIS